jgi:hypothetical protein
MSKKNKNDFEMNQIVSWKKMLQVKILKNSAADFKISNDGRIEVSVKKQKPKYFFPPISWIIRPRLKHTMILDNIGVKILEMSDGKQTVENIIDKFSEEYKLSFHEARVSVTEYIKQLVQRGILVIME